MNRPGHRDARTYCTVGIAELRTLRARWASDPALPQRLVVLSYLVERSSASAAEFERELTRLSADASPAIASAALAILLEWRGMLEWRDEAVA